MSKKVITPPTYVGPEALNPVFNYIEYLPEIKGPFKLRAPIEYYDQISIATDVNEEHSEFLYHYMVDYDSLNKDPDPKYVYMGSRFEKGWPAVLKFFGKTGDEAAMNGHVHPKVLGSRRGQGEARLPYPFHTLINLGDYFFVPDGKRETIAVYASNYTKYAAPEKMMTVRSVPGGVLVMLLWKEGAVIDSKRIVQP